MNRTNKCKCNREKHTFEEYCDYCCGELNSGVKIEDLKIIDLALLESNRVLKATDR